MLTTLRALKAMSSRKKGHKLMHKLSRFLPGSLIRRWLAVREAEVQREIIMEEVYNAGWRACERKLTGASA